MCNSTDIVFFSAASVPRRRPGDSLRRMLQGSQHLERRRLLLRRRGIRPGRSEHPVRVRGPRPGAQPRVRRGEDDGYEPPDVRAAAAGAAAPPAAAASAPGTTRVVHAGVRDDDRGGDVGREFQILRPGHVASAQRRGILRMDERRPRLRLFQDPGRVRLGGFGRRRLHGGLDAVRVVRRQVRVTRSHAARREGAS